MVRQKDGQVRMSFAFCNGAREFKDREHERETNRGHAKMTGSWHVCSRELSLNVLVVHFSFPLCALE